MLSELKLQSFDHTGLRGIATKVDSMKKSGTDGHITDADEKDHLNAELKDRIAILEEELDRQRDANTALRRHDKDVLGWPFKFTQTLLDAIPIPVFYKNAHGVYLGCNKAFAEFIGKPRSQIISSTVFDISPAALAEIYYQADEGLISHPGTQQYEGAISDARGVVHTVVFYKATVLKDDGTVDGIIGTFIDVTGRKMAEKALHENEERLRLCVATASLGIFDWDMANDRHIWSPETYEIYGVSRDTPLTFDLIKGMIYPEDRQDDVVLAELERATSRGGYTLEYRIVRASDGAVRWIHTKTRIFFEGDGVERRTVRMLGVVQDITDRKLIEAALKEAKQQSELYLDLMGHDINNMHQITLGYLELAQGMTPGVAQSEMIGKSIEVLQRSTQLIRNVGKLQKLNEDLGQVHEVDVGSVLHAVKREFGMVPGKEIRLNFNGDGHCFILANELLYDVFANLVSNAIKYTGDHAVIAVDMDVVADNGQTYCRVSVEDDGPGIPDDFKPRIFNRLLRGPSKAKGMGLGLYLVKSLVDRCGGRTWVEDRVPGDYTKGARFMVMLPIVDN